MLNENKNLEKDNSKARKVLKWLGIFFIASGILIPVIFIIFIFISAGGESYLFFPA